MTRPTLVFDLDGTLVHSAPDILGTLDHILDREGIARLPHDDALPHVGSGARVLLQRAFKALQIPLSEERLQTLFTDFLAHYETRIAQESHLFFGAETALSTLRAEGHRLAICTNKTEKLARLLIDRLNASHHFDAICGRDSFAYQKPDGRHIISTIKAAGGVNLETPSVKHNGVEIGTPHTHSGVVRGGDKTGGVSG